MALHDWISQQPGSSGPGAVEGTAAGYPGPTFRSCSSLPSQYFRRFHELRSISSRLHASQVINGFPQRLQGTVRRPRPCWVMSVWTSRRKE